MSEYRTIKTRIWYDPFFQGLTSSGKLLFIYLFTNEAVDCLGIFEVTADHIAYETAIPKNVVMQLLKEFQLAGKISTADGRILVHNFIDNQTNHNPKVLTGQRARLEKCKSPKLRGVLQALYPDRFQTKNENWNSLHIDKDKKKDSDSDSDSDNDMQKKRVFSENIEYDTLSYPKNTLSNQNTATTATVDLQVKEKQKPAKAAEPSDTIPYEAIRDLYNKNCVPFGLKACAQLNDERRKAIRARCSEKPEFDGQKLDFTNIENWDIYFTKAAQNEYVLGHKNDPNNERYKNWKGSFDYLISPRGFARVIEGRE